MSDAFHDIPIDPVTLAGFIATFVEDGRYLRVSMVRNTEIVGVKPAEAGNQ